MGTDRFREDVSKALKVYLNNCAGQRPRRLKVNFRDAMAWHTKEGSTALISDFVRTDVKAYVNSIPSHGSTLECDVELLNVDDDSRTRFK